MKFDPENHHRRSIRLKEYDYTRPGWYFVTIVVQNRQSLLSEIVDKKLILYTPGKIVETEWNIGPKLRNNIELDEYIIMPNHFHGIIHILEKSVRAIGPIAPTKPTIKPNSLGSILGQFKSVTTKKIQRAGAPNFKWQRNYWERVHPVRYKNFNCCTTILNYLTG